jgi:GT2 family glycosyltransferase
MTTRKQTHVENLQPPLVSVVLGTYNRLRLLKKTIKTVRKELGCMTHEIIIVDGGSTDGATEWLAGQKDVITIIQHNRGTWHGTNLKRRSWGYFMNLGFKCAHGKYVCMISDDCLVVPGAIRFGCELFEKEMKAGRRVGAVAFYWRNWPDQTSYMVGYTLNRLLYVNHGLYLREALRQVGFVDEAFSFYHGDQDLCLKMWAAGYECIDSPKSYIEHYIHADWRFRRANAGSLDSDRLAFLTKWTGIYYHGDDGPIEGWCERDFIDDTATAGTWRRLDLMNLDPTRLALRAIKMPLVKRVLAFLGIHKKPFK